MLKTEASAERTTLRSASPHRNAYRAEFQALKKAFDQPRQDGDPKLQDPERVRQPRGRQYGAHVSRIKDMFMQMGSENAGSNKTRTRDETSPQKLTKPTNFINRTDGSVIKLQHGTGERTSKFSETRKLFEQSSRDTSQSPVYSYGKDKRGSHEHLDDWRGARSNRGSTDSLDSLCSRTEASSPTVSQLSAVFENIDHQQQGFGAPVRRGYGGGRTLYSPDGFHRHGEASEDDASARQSPSQGVYRTRVGGKHTLPVSSSSEDLLSPSPLSEAADQGRSADKNKAQEKTELDTWTTEEVDGPSKQKQEGTVTSTEATGVCTASVGVSDTLVSNKTSESARDPTSTKVQEDAEEHDKKESNRITEDQTEEPNEEYCGNERVIFNADGDACYQGWGESCTDLDDDLYGDEDVYYDPGSEITEIPGLPEEEQEDVPPKRKIRFSTAPMTVFKTYSNEDYDRRNEDVDPVASSAEYELEKRVEKLELFPVELEKDEDGLGISIIGMGVGADAGLEKLGIFVKTVIESGAAERDGRIKVNDQIVEVDGTSLVGVTQSFAASVLRNTHGVVRFMIGRERPGQQSEVAQLISQTLEQERRQREMLEQQYAQYDADDDETGEYATDEEEEESGTAKTGGDVTIEVFDLPENEDIVSPSELDATKLYQKFRELQIKHTVTEAEIQKLKNKLAAVEKEKQRWEREKTQLKQSIEENKERMLKLESYWIEAQTLCHTVNEHLKEAQSQYQALEKKYNKAKKLIKDFQQKEVEFVQREDAEKKRLEEVEKAHLAEIQGLQIRIATLETELMQLMKQNGIQVNNNNNSAESRAQLNERLAALQYPGRTVPGGGLGGAGLQTEPADSEVMQGLRQKTSRAMQQDSASSAEGEDSLERRASGISHSSLAHALSGEFAAGGAESGALVSVSNAEASHRHQQGLQKDLDTDGSPVVSNISLNQEEKSMKRLLDLGSSLRRSKGKDKDSRASAGNSSTEPSAENSPEKLKSKKSLSWPHFFSYSYYLGPNVSDDLSISSTSSAEISGLLTEPKISGRSHTLVLSSDESLEMIDDEILDEVQCPKQHHWQNRSVTEWTCQQVCHWLLGLNLEQYIPQFTAKNIDGEQLLQLDSSALKDLGVDSTQDRALIKKKLKDLKVLMEKARKNREKLEKQREKLRKKELEQVQKQAHKSNKTPEPAEGAAE
ncbi:neurabin-1 [Chanos chanos]|uniref:Neurabin-1 n=1 Tax=Chanos chanos TaxID=29144 RepID=A0A6J2WL65_CHACN|nr:neurabin-1 [Chanos chanos]